MNNDQINYPSIEILIPTWNGLHLLKRTLDATVMASQNYSGPSSIVVIDNGSNDRTCDVIKDFYPSITLIENKTNLGFGAAINQGASISKADLLFLMNNDLFINKNFFNDLIYDYMQIENIFSICPQTNYWSSGILTDDVFTSSINFSYSKYSGLKQHWAVDDLKNIAAPREPTIYGTGAALLVSSIKFKKLGGLDEIYGLGYWEDADLCIRAWKMGWPSFYTSGALAWHMVSATTNQIDDKFKEGLMKKNEILFKIIHFGSIKDKFNIILSCLKNKSINFKLALNISIRVVKDMFYSKRNIEEVIECVAKGQMQWSGRYKLIDKL